MLQKEAKNARLKEIDVEIKRVMNNPTLTGKQKMSFLEKAEAEIEEIKTEFRTYEKALAGRSGTEAGEFGMGSGADYFGAADTQTKGFLSDAQTKELDLAMKSKRPITLEVDVRQGRIQTKAASSESALVNGPLPGIIQPNRFISIPYEPNRIASYLPGAAMDGPSAVWLSHTSNAAEANGVAELGSKPDLGMVFTENKVLPQKLAGQASVTLEFNQDYPEVGGWIQTELQRSLINQENNYLLNATTGGSNSISGGPVNSTFNGFLNTSGTLTRDATGTNGLDAIALAAMDLRSSSSSYSEPDLLVVHPETATGLLTVKDNQGRYLLDMLQGPAGSLTWNGSPAVPATTNPSLGGIWPQGHEGGNLSLFGIPTVQSSQITPGTGLMLSIRGGAAVYWTRLNMLIIFDPYTGLTNNTFRWVAESRVSLSTPRVGSINVISNLPVA